MYNILQWQLQNKYFFEMLKKKRKKNIKLANTSGHMTYGIFKCYNFHFNNYVGFSIIIKNEENRTTFRIGETICLECAANTIQFTHEIPPFVGLSDLVVHQHFQKNREKASMHLSKMGRQPFRLL